MSVCCLWVKQQDSLGLTPPLFQQLSQLWQTNSTMDGVYEHVPHDGSFIFTSESVGEGHPGKYDDHVHTQTPDVIL